MPPMQHSGSMTSYPVAQQGWLAPPVDVQNRPQDSSRSNKVLFVVIGVALLLGVIITVAATRGGSNETKAPPDAEVTQAVVIDATAITKVVDAEPVVAVAIDAAPKPVVVDASEAVAIVVDAARAPKPIDAAIVTKAPVDAAPPKPTLAEKIQRAFDEGRFSDTVAACSERVPSDRAVTCMQAACQLGESAKAKAWLAKVSSSKRTDVIAACKEHGVDLTPRVVRPPKVDAGVVDCVAEPLRCQH
jgi:hypothetical protein